MSRAVRWIRRWRVVERTGGSRGGGVPRGVITGFLWYRGGFPERSAWFIGRGRANLKRRKTLEQEDQLGRMQQGNTPTTAGWGEPGDGIRCPGRERQDTPVRMLHDVFKQLSHPAYIAERQRVATQGVDRIPDRDRSERGLERMCSLLVRSRSCMTGQRRRLSNWLQNQNGKRSLSQIALASDLGAHAKMRYSRYSSRSRDDHDMCLMQISPAASTK